MELITILNQCHHFRDGLREGQIQPDRPTTIEVRPTPQGLGSPLPGCHQSAPGCDHLAERQFEFIPLGLLVFLLIR
jgi:hypothetical protein